MPEQRITFDQPDRVAVGSVGRGEERALYVQVRQRSTLATFSVDLRQIVSLAVNFAQALDKYLATDVDAEATLIDIASLDLPLVPLFHVGTTILSLDADGRRIVLEMFETQHSPVAGPPDQLRSVQVTVTARQARLFVSSARALVAADASVCPFCTQPLHPGGHLCPRTDGYRPPG